MEHGIKGLEQSINRLERSINEIGRTFNESANRVVNPYRNMVIEEVAQKIETMQGFGQDTIQSFTIFIRSMKK